MDALIQLVTGCLAATVISLTAYCFHSLSRSGALAAALVGTVVFGFGGWQWAVLLLAFFISSTLLTRLFKKRKITLDEKFAKGGQRDAGQVLANGGIAALFAGLSFFFPDANWLWWAFAASMAAVTADTWATELGVLNPDLPRLITNGRRVEKGTSGAISPYGTLSALAGSLLISLLAVFVSPVGGRSLPIGVMLLLLVLAGLLGAMFDSWLGATVQGIYHCPVCDKDTERHPWHLCGAQTVQIRGWKWLDNDLVNAACAASGAVIAWLACAVFVC